VLALRTNAGQGGFSLAGKKCPLRNGVTAKPNGSLRHALSSIRGGSHAS